MRPSCQQNFTSRARVTEDWAPLASLPVARLPTPLCLAMGWDPHSLFLFLAAHHGWVVELAISPLIMTESHIGFKSGPRTLLFSPLALSSIRRHKKRRTPPPPRSKGTANKNCPTFLPSSGKALRWLRVGAPRTTHASRVEIHDPWRWNCSSSTVCTVGSWPLTVAALPPSSSV